MAKTWIIVGVVVLSGALTAAGNPPPPPTPIAESPEQNTAPTSATEGHHEKPHDAYLPPPVQPENPMPGAIVTRGNFTSVQVNVDAAGNNILGDAANEPSIAVDPNNGDVMAIGWRQFDNVSSNFRQAGVAYTQDGGTTWTFPGVLQPGQFRSDPILASDGDGVFYYYSLSTLTSAEFFKSTDGGVNWSGPTPGFGGDKAWITVDNTFGVGRGNVYAIWNRSFSCCPLADFTRSTDGAETFMDPIGMGPGPRWGTISVGPDGEVYVSGVGTRVLKSSNAQDPDQTPFFDFSTFVNLGGSTISGTGPNPGGLLGQVWIATDHSGGATHANVYLLASVSPTGADPLDVMFARSTDGGISWSQPIRVNDDGDETHAWQWFGTMSVAPNGRIDAFWNDTRNTGVDRLSELYYAFSTDAGETWSQNVPVSPVFDSHIGWPDQFKIGDYYHSVSDDGGVDLAYAATFNGEQDVYHLRIAQLAGQSDNDGDGDTDLEDYAVFAPCVSGDHTDPEFEPPSEACLDFDFDLDEDVDTIDFAAFQARFTGDCGVTLTSSPEDQLVCLYDQAVFQVEADGSDLTYEWRLNGDILPDANEAMLVVDPVTLQTVGTYRAFAIGGCGFAASDSATLQVHPPPQILESPQLVITCLGGTASFSVSAEGIVPLTYQWQLDGQNIAGADAAMLIVDPVTPDDVGDYGCLVTDGCGRSTTSEEAALTVMDIFIQAQPQGGEFCAGGSLFLFVSATGVPAYQWFKDDAPIAGATLPFLAIGDLTAEDAGVYHVVITNDCQDVISAAAVVTIIDCTG